MNDSITKAGSITLIFVILIGVVSLFFISEKRQKLIVDYAEINDVKYGLLSVHAWKGHLAEILTKKVQEFDLTTENRREFKSSIQSAMYSLFDELDRIVEEKKRNSGRIERLFRNAIENLVFDIGDLRKRVPEFTEIILDEMDNPESREKLRRFVQGKINEFVTQTVGEEDLFHVNRIMIKYGCDEIDNCNFILGQKQKELDEILSMLTLFILTCSIVIFFILIVGESKDKIFDLNLLILTCFILLLGGLGTPMIDIDARIDNFKFTLVGEPLTFNDQILFFQSKSISEVVSILVTTGDFQSILVGLLIFIFSIIFPLAKLFASTRILRNQELANNKMINFLAFRSGKWSMADVVVVAIFMAYIGFRGIIENQLSQIEEIGSNIDILTTDNSDFGVGFILFFSYCIGSLVISSEIEKFKKKTELNSEKENDKSIYNGKLMRFEYPEDWFLKIKNDDFIRLQRKESSASGIKVFIEEAAIGIDEYIETLKKKCLRNQEIYTLVPWFIKIEFSESKVSKFKNMTSMICEANITLLSFVDIKGLVICFNKKGKNIGIFSWDEGIEALDRIEKTMKIKKG